MPVIPVPLPEIVPPVTVRFPVMVTGPGMYLRDGVSEGAPALAGFKRIKLKMKTRIMNPNKSIPSSSLSNLILTALSCTRQRLWT
jgi:hypothetical protein